MNCPKCGNELENNQKYCNLCGTPVKQQISVNYKKTSVQEEKWVQEY